MKYINTFQVLFLLLISTSIAVPVSLSDIVDTIGALVPIPNFNATESQSGSSDGDLLSSDSVDTATVGNTGGDAEWSGLNGQIKFNGTLPLMPMGPGPVVFPKGINGGTDSEDKFVKSALELIQQLNSTINNMAKSLSSKSKVSTQSAVDMFTLVARNWATPSVTSLPSSTASMSQQSAASSTDAVVQGLVDAMESAINFPS